MARVKDRTVPPPDEVVKELADPDAFLLRLLKPPEEKKSCCSPDPSSSPDDEPDVGESQSSISLSARYPSPMMPASWTISWNSPTDWGRRDMARFLRDEREKPIVAGAGRTAARGDSSDVDVMEASGGEVDVDVVDDKVVALLLLLVVVVVVVVGDEERGGDDEEVVVVVGAIHGPGSVARRNGRLRILPSECLRRCPVTLGSRSALSSICCLAGSGGDPALSRRCSLA